MRIFDENHRYGLVKVSTNGYVTCNCRSQCNPNGINNKTEAPKKAITGLED